MDQAKLNHLRKADAADLKRLLAALNGAKNSLRRDECGDPTIFGSRGHIHACDGKFAVYITTRSGQAWTFVKKMLATIAVVRQDGDEEGILELTQMPTEDEAEVIRKYIGLRQTRDVPPERAQKLKERV